MNPYLLGYQPNLGTWDLAIPGYSPADSSVHPSVGMGRDIMDMYWQIAQYGGFGGGWDGMSFDVDPKPKGKSS